MRTPSKKFSTAVLAGIGLLLSAGAVLAQAAKDPVPIKKDAPERYVVVPGDTLWGIAQRYTSSPWRWPELWKLNQGQIKDPHLIYPGNVIVLDRSTGTLRKAGSRRGSSGSASVVKLSPKVRVEESTEKGIPSIPASMIEPFLTRPLVVEPGGLDNAPTIVATEEERVVLGAGHRAYVSGIGTESPAENWQVYRQGDPLVDPDSKRTLGFEAIYLGSAKLRRSGEPATIELLSVKREVSKGDKLIPVSSSQPVSYAPHAPSAKVEGKVISIFGALGTIGEAGLHSVIVINRGKNDGMEIGHVVALHSRPIELRDAARREIGVQTPDERYGLAFVFRVFEHVSYALVVSISKPVAPLDVVRNP